MTVTTAKTNGKRKKENSNNTTIQHQHQSNGVQGEKGPCKCSKKNGDVKDDCRKLKRSIELEYDPMLLRAVTATKRSRLRKI